MSSGPAGCSTKSPAPAARTLVPEHVSRYDGKEDASASAEVALLCGLGLTKDSVVVDIGAGTGQFTLAVAAQCARVIAIDVSSVMLDRLQSRSLQPRSSANGLGVSWKSTCATSTRRSPGSLNR
jgi:2-polyprenyl-3-methyl-5-hydroxy-6-metoxy-1,4-benzoquinol methylase